MSKYLYFMHEFACLAEGKNIEVGGDVVVSGGVSIQLSMHCHGTNPHPPLPNIFPKLDTHWIKMICGVLESSWQDLATGSTDIH